VKRVVLFTLFLFTPVLFNRVMDQFEDGETDLLCQLLTEVDSTGLTTLHFAAFNGDVECVKLCFELVHANVDVRSDDGFTPLHLASLNGHVDAARVLLDAGAFVDATDAFWGTPLHGAILNNHMDIARLMIDWGAKVSNVKLDKELPAIPNWITPFIESRSKCRVVCIIIIGIHKYHRTNITGNNDINVLRIIGKHIWSTRMDDMWVTPPIDTKY
jgi:ankyrin repeat protein